MRQQQGFGNRKPGVLPWGHSVSLTNGALRSIQEPGDIQFATLLSKLQLAMDTGRPNRNDLAVNARGAAARLKPWITKLDQQLLNRKWVDQLDFLLLTKPGDLDMAGTDEITQVHLGLAALMASGERELPVSNAAKKQATHVPRSPMLYDPEAIRHRLQELKKLSPRKER